MRKIEIDLTDKIKAALAEEQGNEEEISQEAWAEEKNKGKTLNKPFRTSGGPKKFSVYVKNEKGNIVKVNFGDPNMEIKRDSPERRKSFRARHNCENPGPKTKARYWSCKMWSKKSVTNVTKGSEEKLLKDLDESEAELTEKQKKLPPEVQKKILKKQGKDTKSVDKKDSEKKDAKESSEAKRGLWENIHRKRQRIKDGSGEKMRKKGDKGAPTEKQIKQAQKKKGESKAEEEFKPHKMYDKNGKAYDAKSKEDHLRMKKMGYTHEDPKMKSKSGYKKKKY
jgi:hypothetical protein